MCVSADSCLPAVPSCGQLCPGLWEAPGALPPPWQPTTKPQPVLGTNTARVAALEMLCFDKILGDFSSICLMSPAGSLPAPGSVSEHKAATASEGHGQQNVRLSQLGWLYKAINPLVFPPFIHSVLSMHQILGYT